MGHIRSDTHMPVFLGNHIKKGNKSMTCFLSYYSLIPIKYRLLLQQFAV